MNMHINILERQELRKDSSSTFHIHTPVQSTFHQKAFSNMTISVKTFSQVRVRGLVAFMANSKKQMAWHGDSHIWECIQKQYWYSKSLLQVFHSFLVVQRSIRSVWVGEVLVSCTKWLWCVCMTKFLPILIIIIRMFCMIVATKIQHQETALFQTNTAISYCTLLWLFSSWLGHFHIALHCTMHWPTMYNKKTSQLDLT